MAIAPIATSRCMVISLLLLFCLAGHAAPGDLDATFGQNGRVLQDIPGTSGAWANNFFEQADGKIVAVGFAQAGANNRNFLVVRFNADGSLDSTFGVGGHVQFDLSGTLTDDVGESGAQQIDGKLVVVGGVGPFGSGQAGIVRLHADGSFDNSFNGNGKLLLTVGTGTRAIDAFARSDGSIVVAATNGNFTFIGLTAAGALNPNFGSAGILTIDFNGSSDTVRRAIQQSDGKFVAVGAANNASAQAAVRINANGTPDASFNGTGKLDVPCSAALCEWSGVAQQADKLLFAGFTTVIGGPLPQYDSNVARYNANGVLDTSFAAGGRISTVFRNAVGVPLQVGEQANAVVVLPDGKINVLGTMTGHLYTDNGDTPVGSWFTITTRLTPNGSIDTAYGVNGYAVVPLSSSVHAYNNIVGRSILRTADDRLLALAFAGEYGTNSTLIAHSIGIARLSNGPGHPGILAIDATGSTVSEDVGSVYFRVARNGGRSGAVSVSYTTQSESAQSGLDFVATSGTLHWADGEIATRLIQIPIVADSFGESNPESFSVVLHTPTGGASLGAGSRTMSIARDDIAPAKSITLSQSPVSVTEGQASVTVSVARTGTGPASVNYFALPESATIPSDFEPKAGILVWANGDTSPKNIVIPIVNDDVFEANERFFVILLAPSVQTVMRGSIATITINDDGPPPQLSIAPTVSVDESQASVAINVTRTGATTTTVSATYTSTNGTATAGADYSETTGTITWLPGDSDTKTITIPLLGDTSFEGNEAFTVVISNPTGGATLGTATATVTINEDDQAPQSGGGSGTNGGGGGGGGGGVDLFVLFLLCQLGLLRSSILGVISTSVRARSERN